MNLAMKFFSLPKIAALAVGAALFIGSHPAQAQVSGLTFSFLPASQTVSFGGSADYTGQFVNSSTTDYEIILGDYSPDADTGSPLITGFFNGDPSADFGPFEVAAGSIVTIPAVFTLSADPALGSGTYGGTVDFLGQTVADYQAGGDDTVLATAPITLTIAGTSPVPEASPALSLGVLLALGLGGVLWSARRKRADAR